MSGAGRLLLSRFAPAAELSCLRERREDPITVLVAAKLNPPCDIAKRRASARIGGPEPSEQSHRFFCILGMLHLPTSVTTFAISRHARNRSAGIRRA